MGTATSTTLGRHMLVLNDTEKEDHEEVERTSYWVGDWWEIANILEVAPEPEIWRMMCESGPPHIPYSNKFCYSKWPEIYDVGSVVFHAEWNLDNESSARHKSLCLGSSAALWNFASTCCITR